MSRLKMAVVGVGALGRHHARILSELDSVELVAVAETNPVAGQAVAEKCHTRWVADYNELFGEIDAVSIVVPTFAHLAVASEFLSRRIPVLVEKPLAASIDHGERLVELAEQTGTLLQVGHVERFNPATAVAWSHCGSPKYIRAERVSPYAFRSTDIGAVHDLMIHDLDLVLDLVAAPVRSVEAFGISILGENEDSVQARVTFENGCIADLTANRVNPKSSRTMQIWSAEGTVTVDFTSREVVAYRPSEALLYGMSPLQRARQPGADVERLKSEIFGTFLKVERPAVPQTDALTAELESFVDCVRNERRPLVDGQTALRAMQLADQILASVHSHQWEGHAGGAIGPFARPRQAIKRVA
ncbi:MAG: Gfo/Idh/MocA family oxidoreductase [Planctomycetaceae bacterium]